MYYKGANMLHTLRQLIGDDEKWRHILRGLNKAFYHQTVTTQQIEDYLSIQTEIDLTEFFNQYLRDTRIPTFEYSIKDKKLHYRWIDIVDNFDMPIKISIDGKEIWVQPTNNWDTKDITSNEASIIVDRNFYVNIVNNF